LFLVGRLGRSVITWTLYTGIVRPDLWYVQGYIVQTCVVQGYVVQESGSSGVWTVGVVGRSFGVVGQAHIRLWLYLDRWQSKFRGSCTLPWALPCLRVLVAVSSVRPGLPSPSTTGASSAIPQIIPQTPHVTLLLELALIVQPITVRDEQLLEASGKILDHIVSTAPLVLIHHRGHLPSCLIMTRSHDSGIIPGRRASLNAKPVGKLLKLAALLCANAILTRSDLEFPVRSCAVRSAPLNQVRDDVSGCDRVRHPEDWLLWVAGPGETSWTRTVPG
jgi:hypothetical protein